MTDEETSAIRELASEVRGLRADVENLGRKVEMALTLEREVDIIRATQRAHGTAMADFDVRISRLETALPPAQRGSGE